MDQSLSDAIWYFISFWRIHMVPVILTVFIFIFLLLITVNFHIDRDVIPMWKIREWKQAYICSKVETFFRIYFNNQARNTRQQCNLALARLLSDDPKRSVVLTLMTPYPEMKLSCTISNLVAWIAWASFYSLVHAKPSFRTINLNGTDWQYAHCNRKDFLDTISYRLNTYGVVIVTNFQMMHPVFAKMVAHAAETCTRRTPKALFMLIISVRRGIPKDLSGTDDGPACVLNSFIRDQWGTVAPGTKQLLRDMLAQHTIVVVPEPKAVVVEARLHLQDPNFACEE